MVWGSAARLSPRSEQWNAWERMQQLSAGCATWALPYLLAIGAFRWVSMSRNKLQPHYIRQVIIQQEHSDPPRAKLPSSSWARLLCTTACCGIPLKNMTKFFWRASEEMECWASHSQSLHFAVGEWNLGTEPCPGSCRKCFGNDSILLHLLALQLPAPMYSLHGAITGDMLAMGTLIQNIPFQPLQNASWPKQIYSNWPEQTKIIYWVLASGE